MKTITLIRHAKSSWESPSSDRERPLTERGIKDALAVAAALWPHLPEIEAVYTSPAKRALDTCQLMMGIFSFPKENVSVQEKLYDFSGNQVMTFIKSIPEEIRHLMIFGHNEAMTNLINDLTHARLDHLPTSGATLIEFPDSHWARISKGTLKALIIPKNLDNRV